jgi:PBSX family phage portal protein
MTAKKKDDDQSVTDNQPTVRAHVIKSKSKDRKKLLSTLLNPRTKDPMKIEKPPLNPEKISELPEKNSILGPLIGAYATNIDSRGHSFVPAIDLNSPDAVDQVRDAMFVEALRSAQDREESLDSVSDPTDKEVEKRIKILKREARLELATARSFFSSCVPDSNFIDLRKKTRYDKEATGNGYWEVIRGENGKPRSFVFIKSRTMRIGKGGPGDNREVPVKVWQSITDLTWERVTVRRSFKRFAKVDDAGTPSIWFKEFGDPRLMSQKTGDYFGNMVDLVEAEGKEAKAATEILHFDIYSPGSIYGVPRYAGNIPAILGSRELDETNLDYFLSNAVPALALLVAGGRFGSEVRNRVEEFFTEEVRGRKATHKLIVLEAESTRRGAGAPTPNPRIDFVPLRNAQINDALFQEYDKANAKKISMSFRIPPALVGGGDFTVADLRFAEEQVYQPEREDFDAVINNTIMLALGVKFWKFRSDATVARDPEVIGKLIIEAARVGLVVPAEARKVLELVFSQNFPVIRATWAGQPIPFTMAALGVLSGPAEAVREQGRQSGDENPINRLLSDLGLGPEESAVALSPPPKKPDKKKPEPEGGGDGKLPALPGLVPNEDDEKGEK